MYIYHDGDKDKNRILSEFRKQLPQKYEMDKILESLIAPFIKDKKKSILDACCGIGQISHYLSQTSPESEFFGIDQTGYLIDEAKSLWNNSKIKFVHGDVFAVEEKFDISILWKVLSWLPSYDKMLEKLISLTRENIFLSSLFYDGDIDFEIKVREYQTERGKTGFNSYYNVYSLPHFTDYVKSLGVKCIDVTDFEISLDIPRTTKNHMATYTERLENGKRLQISGACLMNWKIVRLDI